MLLYLCAVHGSYLRNWSAIQQQGLSRMKRTHIHLASGLPGEDGVISGMRKDCDLAVFIDVPRALGKLLPKYFSRALRLRPTSKESDQSHRHTIFDFFLRKHGSWANMYLFTDVTFVLCFREHLATAVAAQDMVLSVLIAGLI
uniref:tRNA phosphotransferase 1 n=1 Tax=Stegastes partitus TaxID=144197 RepID=A0A3B4ZQG0_9TELE